MIQEKAGTAINKGLAKIKTNTVGWNDQWSNADFTGVTLASGEDQGCVECVSDKEIYVNSIKLAIANF